MLRTCKNCNRTLNITKFAVAGRKPDGTFWYRYLCKPCYRDSKYIWQRKVRAWFMAYKKRQCCTQCGNADYRVIEFHHEHKHDKDFCIGDYLKRHSIERVKQELAKCIPLCANCHRIVHYEANNTSEMDKTTG